MNVNPTYANDMAYAQFIGVIADNLQKKMADKIDGDTDISNKECEIVYARVIDNGRPTNILIGHNDVQHACAEGKECEIFVTI